MQHFLDSLPRFYYAEAGIYLIPSFCPPMREAVKTFDVVLDVEFAVPAEHFLRHRCQKEVTPSRDKLPFSSEVSSNERGRRDYALPFQGL